jgi:hypothetical protein
MPRPYPGLRFRLPAMLRPYDIRFQDPNNAMHMIGHHNEFIGSCIWEMKADPSPCRLYYVPELRPVEDTLPSVRTDSHEVGARPSVVIAGQSHRTSPFGHEG